MPASRHGAFGIAGHAGSAHIRPDVIDAAGGGFTHLAVQGAAPIALATHSRFTLIDELRRDQIEVRVVLDGEARPVAGIRTARTASLARAGFAGRGCGAGHAAVYPDPACCASRCCLGYPFRSPEAVPSSVSC